MKTLNKSDLLKQNEELSHAIWVRDQYLEHAFRGEVTFISKGGQRLGICGETRAHGGIVLEAANDTGKWYVVGVHYWEAFAQKIRNYPFRHDDKEGQNLRTCVEQASKHIANIQAAFYAPRVADAGQEVQS